ncbi:MAG: hypothetical protein WDO13_17355 [Verrucomicrobiota bacterium]
MTRAPWWLPPISIVAIAMLVVLVSFVFPLVPVAITGQLALLLILVRAFAGWPPLARWVATMPVPHRVVFALLLGGMLLGHHSLNSRAGFPFVVWEIFPFVHEPDPVTCREFIATTAGGAKVRLLAEQQFPSIVQIDPLDALDDPRLYPPGTTERLARALAAMYNAHHPADPVRTVDLVQVAVPLHPLGQTRAQPACELLTRYTVSSAPSR